MATQRGTRKKKAVGPAAQSRRAASRPRFVGRDASPVLDRYPPKSPPSEPKAAIPPPAPPAASVTVTAPAPVQPSPAAPTAQPLITLERPFDPDEFSSLLGETSIRITVPRDALIEVLRRVTEFMGFGIYVYSISVRPASNELLKGFVVELRRVDFSAEKGAWVPFEEKGTVDSPFGPSSHRT